MDSGFYTSINNKSQCRSYCVYNKTYSVLTTYFWDANFWTDIGIKSNFCEISLWSVILNLDITLILISIVITLKDKYFISQLKFSLCWLPTAKDIHFIFSSRDKMHSSVTQKKFVDIEGTVHLTLKFDNLILLFRKKVIYKIKSFDSKSWKKTIMVDS